MIQVRHGVFETNSSSTHSVSLDYSTCPSNYVQIDIPKCETKQILDILQFPIIRKRDVFGSLLKLRIMVAVICEVISEEYVSKLKKEWTEKRDSIAYSMYKNEDDFVMAILRSHIGKEYVYSHRFFRLLNNYLLQRYNIEIILYDTLPYFPYISERLCHIDAENDIDVSRLFEIHSDMYDDVFIQRVESFVSCSYVILRQEVIPR